MTALSTSTWSRRDVLKTASLALPAWFLNELPRTMAAEEESPNGRFKIALVGCGGMGTHDAKLAQKFGDIVAVCDVDETHRGQALENFKGAQAYDDYRKVCDLPDVDAIINATPDHWHTLVNLRAVHSGKDVYSEKPLTLTIDEGKRLVDAVRKTGRVLQVGSQQRSDNTFRLVCELVRNGRLGKLQRVRTWLPEGLHGGPFATQAVPKELNWDVWQGQTAVHDYVPERCHVKFRYWYDYSGGTMTDWGAHHNDIALWGLGKERSGPVSIEGQALSEPVPGGFTAASRYRVMYLYDNGVEHICSSTSANGWAGSVIGKPKEGEKYHGVQFEGPEGWIYVSRGDTLEASDKALIDTPLPTGATRLYASDDHMANFFDCVKTRKAPVADVEIGHRSVSACHLGVISMRLGRKLAWDPEVQRFKDDADANAMLVREMRKPYTYEEA